MMPNKIFLYGILIIILFIAGISVFVLNKPSSNSEQELIPITEPENVSIQKEVIITTDKTQYYQEQIVKITVKNNLDESIFIAPYYPISIQKKLNDGAWRILTLGPPPPPYIPNLEFDYVKINESDSHEFTWDQKIFEQQGKRFLVGEGIFRTFVTYVTESTAQQLGYPTQKGIYPQEGDFITVHSEEFTIK